MGLVNQKSRDWQMKDLEATLPKLPPLPSPTSTGRSPTFGIALVIVTFAAFIGFTALSPSGLRLYLLICTLVETGVALACVWIVVFVEPPHIQRTPESTLPIPREVETRLAAGQTTEGMENVKDESGRTFCVRCLVWRPSGGVESKEDTIFWRRRAKRQTAHHCRYCQRCVIGHDHHCSLIGRCIAGEGGARGSVRLHTSLARPADLLPTRLRSRQQGNLKYVQLGFAMAGLAFLTVCVALAGTAFTS